ncbi:MAG: hypothetical protein DRJ38_00650 [Thermoprotei archaeon]|nr:MAG: hypothetical protein DRJ38_00650 [Thermoprotei archaeon]
MEVIVKVEVRPTEDLKKVQKALENVFDAEDIRIKKADEYRVIIAKSSGYKCLLKLYNMIRSQYILDAAREYLKRGIYGNGIVFYLNKQAAYTGIVSFCSQEYGESPLGAIMFDIRIKNPEKLIDWLTPKTLNGKPIREVEPPNEDP